MFIWSLLGKLKLRNLSFLGSDQMDNLRRDHIEGVPYRHALRKGRQISLRPSKAYRRPAKRV
jgi:hypothetical protein